MAPCLFDHGNCLIQQTTKNQHPSFISESFATKLVENCKCLNIKTNILIMGFLLGDVAKPYSNSSALLRQPPAKQNNTCS